MNPDELRQSLLAIQTRLVERQRFAQRDALKNESGRLTARAPTHMAEQASDEQELDMIVSRLTDSSRTLVDVQEALDRLDAGRFNVCEECGGEIGFRRLEIQPWAGRCVGCQRRIEEERI